MLGSVVGTETGVPSPPPLLLLLLLLNPVPCPFAKSVASILLWMTESESVPLAILGQWDFP